MTALVVQGDARRLPLPDASVDLIVTSPPYFALRSYTDAGSHYEGQIGSEATPAEYLDALWACTAEWMRVLKPEGSTFVNLGDKYAGGGQGGHTGATLDQSDEYRAIRAAGYGKRKDIDFRPKTLLGIPWRYAIGCIDKLGLILRAEIIWSKPNGLPESVTDRVRRSHEQWFHMVKQPRYYAAVDEIREAHIVSISTYTGGHAHRKAQAGVNRESNLNGSHPHPLGKLPGSVWSIPSEPLTVPDHLGVDHFAAFPTEWPRRLILGWSPPGVCTACGQGRWPVADKRYLSEANGYSSNGRWGLKGQPKDTPLPSRFGDGSSVTITGYACACTPYTDHPGSGDRYFRGYEDEHFQNETKRRSVIPQVARGDKGQVERVGPWREYHFDQWTPPPTRPALILDPFGGTGTVALVAHALGRIGISVDMSGDYSRLARWRTTDRGELAKAMRVPKPAPVPDGQMEMFA